MVNTDIQDESSSEFLVQNGFMLEGQLQMSNELLCDHLFCSCNFQAAIVSLTKGTSCFFSCLKGVPYEPSLSTVGSKFTRKSRTSDGNFATKVKEFKSLQMLGKYRGKCPFHTWNIWACLMSLDATQKYANFFETTRW